MKSKNFEKNPNILLVGYNRPNILRENLEHLKSIGQKNIFVHIDGPKNKADEELQEEIRQIIDKFELNSKTHFSDVNLGIIESIPQAIDNYFLNNKENLLIIEDDVLISKNSVSFINKYKDLLLNDNNLFFISLNSPCDKFISETYYSLFPYIWGWYISQSNWEEYRKFKLKKVFTSLAKTFKFQPFALMYWSLIYLLSKNRVLKSWDYDLVFFNICSSKKVLVPKYNLTNNIGFSSENTHTKDNYKKKNVTYNYQNRVIDFSNDVISSKNLNHTKTESKYVFETDFLGLLKKILRRIA